MFGSLGTLILLEPGRFDPDLGWRLAFGIGAVLGAIVLVFRRSLPESPQMADGARSNHAKPKKVVASIERHAPRAAHIDADGPHTQRCGCTRRQRAANLVDLAISLFKTYPRRAVLGLVLMAAQAFFYNAIFFTFALVLATFFDVPANEAGLYILPFAVSNFIGPLVLGWLFDHWGRKRMIAGTYALSGLLLGVTAFLFVSGSLTAMTLTIAFSVVFFFASCAASSAYLTVSESFPLEVRALAIAVFYALGTGLGGVAAPWVFGTLIGSGDPASIAGGYAFGAGLMLAGGRRRLVVGGGRRKKVAGRGGPRPSRGWIE